MSTQALVEIGEPQTPCLGPKLSFFRYSYSLGLSMVRHEPDQIALAQGPRRAPAQRALRCPGQRRDGRPAQDDVPRPSRRRLERIQPHQLMR